MMNAKPIATFFGAPSRWLLVFLFIVGSSFGREGTEWMTSYWYNANDNKLPRVLLIGDSICNGYQPLVRDELAGTACVSFFATSKCVTDPTYLKALAFMLEEYDYKVIQFNNGLHSLNTDRAAWKAGLTAALNLIKEKGKGAKVIWATSTPLKDPALTEKAKELNAIANEVMKANGIPVDDLFALMDPLDRNTFWVDTYHYNENGRKMQAKQVADTIRQTLGAKVASPAEAQTSLAAAASETGPNGKISTTAPSSAPSVNAAMVSKGKWKVWPLTGGVLELSAENPHSGTNAAKITVSSPHTQLYQLAPALEPGATYTLKYWARSAAPLKADAFIRNPAPPYVFLGKNTAEVDTAWKEFSTTFTAPKDPSPGGYNLFFEFQSPGTCWIDDVSLSKQGADAIPQAAGAKVTSPVAAPASASSVNTVTVPKGGWSVYPQTGGVLELSVENPHSGTNAAKITISSPNTQLYRRSPALESGATYTLRYWARSAAPLKADAFIRNPAPPYVFLGKNTAEVDTAWKEFSTTFTAPQDLNPGGYNLFFEFQAPGTCWIDDVSLTKK